MKETKLRRDASLNFPLRLLNRIHYRDTLQQMSDPEVVRLLDYLNRPQTLSYFRREFNRGFPSSAILIPKTGGGERDVYQFGVESEEELTALSEEATMRRAEEPRQNDSFRYRLSKVFG
ncbi:MAG: hypothetical protein Q8P81_02835 [Nanoarchaeota archaeon]|nr:hypothetical protein [Nanoarchaeota archaeon]